MQDTVYLLMDSRGVTGYRKSRPNLKAGEYAVRVKVGVPDEFFQRAIPTATLDIPEGYMIEPPVEVEIEEEPEAEDE